MPSTSTALAALAALAATVGPASFWFNEPKDTRAVLKATAKDALAALTATTKHTQMQVFSPAEEEKPIQSGTAFAPSKGLVVLVLVIFAHVVLAVAYLFVSLRQVMRKDQPKMQGKEKKEKTQKWGKQSQSPREATPIATPLESGAIAEASVTTSVAGDQQSRGFEHAMALALQDDRNEATCEKSSDPESLRAVAEQLLSGVEISCEDPTQPASSKDETAGSKTFAVPETTTKFEKQTSKHLPRRASSAMVTPPSSPPSGNKGTWARSFWAGSKRPKQGATSAQKGDLNKAEIYLAAVQGLQDGRQVSEPPPEPCSNLLDGPSYESLKGKTHCDIPVAKSISELQCSPISSPKSGTKRSFKERRWFNCLAPTAE